jgi:hypothetical protein
VVGANLGDLGAGESGYLLTQQLVAAGEHVVDVQSKLAARARLLATSTTNDCSTS